MDADNQIAVDDGQQVGKAGEVIIQPARPGGWMAWYRSGPHDYWMQAMWMPTDHQARDIHRCPYPLAPTREIAIATATHQLRGRGGEVRVVKVEL